MKHTFKRIASLVMAITLLLGMTLNVSAAEAPDSSVTYKGGAEKFVFLPGSDYTDTDLFNGFKNVMPGDTLTEKIVVKNESTTTDYVNIYMRAVAHDDASNPLSESVAAAEGDAATMHEFLQQLSMKVWNGETLIYEASPDELDGLAENVLLGSFYPGETTELTVELKVPIELGNEYANRVGEVDWVFTAEEIDRTSASVELEAVKYLDGELAEAGAFEFELRDIDGNVLQTVTNGENGVIKFDALTYSDEKEEGEHTYQIVEKKGDKNHIIYDETVYDVTVDVKLSREKYEATTSIFVGEEAYEGIPEFHNETIKETGCVIEGLKLFNGVPALPGTFGFVLIDDNGKIVDTTVNGLYGKISFDKLTFDTPGVYHYQIREIIGVNPVIVYDATVYDVFITVAPGENGYETHLCIKRNGLPYKGIPTFYNKTRKPVDVDLDVDKLLDGLFPEEGQFEFAIIDQFGNTVQTAANGKYAQVDFDKLTFYAPGVYKYKVVEIAGDDENIIYDDTEYEVTITVTPNLPIVDGYNAKVVITVDGELYTGKLTFNNTTVPEEPDDPVIPEDPDDPVVPEDPEDPVEPEDPVIDEPIEEPEDPVVDEPIDDPEDSDTVKTGDNANFGLYIGAMLLAVAAIIAVLVAKRFRKN